MGSGLGAGSGGGGISAAGSMCGGGSADLLSTLSTGVVGRDWASGVVSGTLAAVCSFDMSSAKSTVPGRRKISWVALGVIVCMNSRSF